MRSRRVPGAGRIVLAPPHAPEAVALIAGRPTHDGFAIGDDDWAIDHLVCVGRVACPETYAAAIDLTLRGADVVADVSPDLAAGFLDEVARAGLHPWEPEAGGLDAETCVLLDELAAGASVAAAARRCHVSERSAHRRLAAVRAVLGVSTTAEVVATWSARRSDEPV